MQGLVAMRGGAKRAGIEKILVTTFLLLFNHFGSVGAAIALLLQHHFGYHFFLLLDNLQVR